MRLAILCLLSSAIFPLVIQAQGPVFEVNHAESSVNFTVQASIPESPWNFSYQVPFRFTGVIDKLTLNLGPRQWSELDRKTVEEMVARARD
jgi:hypothetical protein